MTREEFIKELEGLLSDIPVEEKDSAIEYYNDYFDDADTNNMDSIIKKLGTPEKIAAIIKADLNVGDIKEEQSVFTENGYENLSYEEEKYEPVLSEQQREEKEEDKSNSFQWERDYDSTRQESKSSWTDTFKKQGAFDNNREIKIVLIVLACIFILPIVVPVVGSALGTVLAIIATVFILAAALSMLTVVSGIASILGIVFSVDIMIRDFNLGLSTFGLSLMLVGITILAFIGAHALWATFIPWMIRGIGDIVRSIFRRKKVDYENNI